MILEFCNGGNFEFVFNHMRFKFGMRIVKYRFEIDA